MAKYTLRVIHPDKWVGVRFYEGAQMGIGPSLDRSGLPRTGLTEDRRDADGNIIEKGNRKEFERLMGLEEGTLAQGSRYKPNDFWVRYVVNIGSSDKHFDTDVPDDALAVEFLKAQTPYVAFGLQNIKAKSEYVLFTKEEEAKQANLKKSAKRRAYAAFEKLSSQDRKDILEVTGVKTSTLSPEVVEDRLTDFVEDFPDKFLGIISDPHRKQKVFVRKCIERGVLNLDGQAVMHGETVLGYNIAAAAENLFSPERASVLALIKDTLGLNK